MGECRGTQGLQVKEPTHGIQSVGRPIISELEPSPSRILLASRTPGGNPHQYRLALHSCGVRG